jgi:hypothetical protein
VFDWVVRGGTNLVIRGSALKMNCDNFASVSVAESIYDFSAIWCVSCGSFSTLLDFLGSSIRKMSFSSPQISVKCRR